MLFFVRLHHDQVSFTTPFSEERWVIPFWVVSPGCYARHHYQEVKLLNARVGIWPRLSGRELSPLGSEAHRRECVRFLYHKPLAWLICIVISVPLPSFSALGFPPPLLFLPPHFTF